MTSQEKDENKSVAFLSVSWPEDSSNKKVTENCKTLRYSNALRRQRDKDIVEKNFNFFSRFFEFPQNFSVHEKKKNFYPKISLMKNTRATGAQSKDGWRFQLIGISLPPSVLRHASAESLVVNNSWPLRGRRLQCTILP